MDSGSRRIRKTVPRHDEKPPPVTEILTTMQVDGEEHTLIEVRATGDVVLDVTFENHRSSSKLLVGQAGTTRLPSIQKNTKSTNTRMLYRVRLDTLKKTSKYFDLLLGSDTFEEGKKIAATFASLQAKGVTPTTVEAHELPRIQITDDDETTRIAGREAVFGDLLRILHAGDISMRLTLPYLATMAVMADRFDCTPLIARYVKASKKLVWPQTYGNMTTATEELLRQKILISWLLDDQVRLGSSTRELILRGSLRWTSVEEAPNKEFEATWWDLQDGLEAELHYRRMCILSTIASLQQHFLAIYTSRTRQCKQFYDSSAACDSYQLGEMIKFFASKGLLILTSPLSYDDYPEAYSGDIENLITILRQCPSYQIDKNHAHCGLRTRIIPALDYIQAMLTSNIGIDRRAWKSDRPAAAWENVEVEETFTFSSGIAGDQRLKMDGFLGANRHAKALFTAAKWNWSPGDIDDAGGSRGAMRIMKV